MHSSLTVGHCNPMKQSSNHCGNNDYFVHQIYNILLMKLKFTFVIYSYVCAHCDRVDSENPTLDTT